MDWRCTLTVPRVYHLPRLGWIDRRGARSRWRKSFAANGVMIFIVSPVVAYNEEHLVAAVARRDQMRKPDAEC